MLPEEAKLLIDMRDAARKITHMLGSQPFDLLPDEDPVRDAVYWNFTIIGEACAQLRKINESLTDRITESWRIIGFRNQVVHGYGKINHAITARIIDEKLPILLAELDELLRGVG